MPPNIAKTFYDILGVGKDVTQDDLRKAWLALARKHHPDKTGGHKGSEEKLKLINEAYDTLKRPEKRRLYDETISGTVRTGSPFDSGAAQGRSAQNGAASNAAFDFDADYADFFGELFGQKTSGRQRGPQPGRDLEAEAPISLKEAATGTKKLFRLPSQTPCQVCSGCGAAPGTKPKTCSKCKGSGHTSGGRGSLFVMSQTCPVCHGRGEVITTPCPACGGSGYKSEHRTISVTIPAGVRTGTRLRLAGQGEPGDAGAPAGDLFVEVNIEENELFERQLNDVICETPITFSQAVLGGTVEVPTLYSKARLKIPPGTQSGAVLKMRGQGFPSLNGGQKGDQLVKVIVETPRTVTQDQIVAIQNLHEETNSAAYPKHHAFAGKSMRWNAG